MNEDCKMAEAAAKIVEYSIQLALFVEGLEKLIRELPQESFPAIRGMGGLFVLAITSGEEEFARYEAYLRIYGEALRYRQLREDQDAGEEDEEGEDGCKKSG